MLELFSILQVKVSTMRLQCNRQGYSMLIHHLLPASLLCPAWLLMLTRPHTIPYFLSAFTSPQYMNCTSAFLTNTQRLIPTALNWLHQIQPFTLTCQKAVHIQVVLQTSLQPVRGLYHAMIDMLNLWAQDKVNANCCITHLNVVILLTSHLFDHLQP